MTTQRSTSPLAALSIPAAHPARPVAACALRVQASEDKTRLIPAGTFDAPRGSMAGEGPWQLDAQGAAAIIALAANRATDIAIDYEHQTLLADRNGQPAPAAGWVDPRSLEWRDDGLYGAVSWTERARTMIEGGEYRYLSPVFPYDAQSGAVLDLLHLALTNTPAIDEGIPRLAAARMAPTPTATPQEDDAVNREQLIALLGLAADATDEQIETGLAALKAQADTAHTLRQALDVGEGDDAAAAVAALKSKASTPASPDMSQYVPKAVFEETTAQLAALKANGDTAELDGLIEAGLKDGRIPGKATADWLREQGLAACKAHLAGAPSIAALKGPQTQGRAPEGDDAAKGALSEAELAVCKAMGLTPEAYRAANPVE
ncbi:phage protease [Halomonas alimentaria]|uniref:Protease (I) and scaffold (Z) protein n=1 Tax=Halomonas alimentaria TaxID=147248 RepID=A0A7X4W2M5_9GAMM|nr:phage protease [Halomonas alimentaria]NAW33238.1 protease (I) and scaffold (Z) protein [Halomonas alimentaria]